MNKLTLLDRVQEKRLEKFLKEIGESRAVERFLSNYGKLNTKTTYSAQLALYFRWLRTKGIQMTPDELIRDNLECLYKSDPIDIATKLEGLAKEGTPYFVFKSPMRAIIAWEV